jgi:hypothetical protein
MKWYEKIGAQLFEPDRPVQSGELLFFKIFELFVLVYIIKFSWEWGIYSQFHNKEVVLPLGIANYIDVSIFFDHYISIGIAALTSILAIFSFLRKGPKWLYMVVMILMHLEYVIRYSQGEIPHSQNLIGMAVFSFALGAIFFPGREKMPRFVLGSIIFFIGLGYTSAFVSKMIGTGIDWFDGRHFWLWISEKGVDILSREGAFQPNFIQELALEYIPVASAILLFGWFTELIGFTMWWKKIRPYTTILLLSMHVGITLTMNIRFDAFVMQLILVGFPWYILFNKYVTRTPDWLSKVI